MTVEPWTLGALALLTTFGPGAAAFFFTRWLKGKDAAEAEAKAAETEKLDQVLAITKRLEAEVNGLSQRLALSDALQNQMKGALEKVEERINGLGNNYGKRVADLEALTQRLDERTRSEPRRPRGRR
jgi:chromosome segregation ATPase